MYNKSWSLIVSYSNYLLVWIISTCVSGKVLRMQKKRWTYADVEDISTPKLTPQPWKLCTIYRKGLVEYLREIYISFLVLIILNLNYFKLKKKKYIWSYEHSHTSNPIVPFSKKQCTMHLKTNIHIYWKILYNLTFPFKNVKIIRI